MSSFANRKTDCSKVRPRETDERETILGDIEQLEKLTTRTKNIKLTNKNDFEGIKQSIIESIGCLSDKPTVKQLVDAHYNVCYFFANNYQYEHTNIDLFDCTVQQYCENMIRICNEIVAQLGMQQPKRIKMIEHIVAPVVRKCMNESSFYP